MTRSVSISIRRMFVFYNPGYKINSEEFGIYQKIIIHFMVNVIHIICRLLFIMYHAFYTSKISQQKSIPEIGHIL